MDEAQSGPADGSGIGATGMGDTTRSEPSANPGLKQQAIESVRDAREQVRERAGAARDSATRMVDERKRTLAESVLALASAFDAAAASLSEGNQTRMADWSRELSGRAHRIAGYLEEQDTRGLVTDLEGTARQHPTAFLGSTFAAGLAAGRFLRSSSATDTGLPATTDPGVGFGYEADDTLLPGETGYGSTSYSASTPSVGSTGPTGETFGSRIGESPAAATPSTPSPSREFNPAGGYQASGSTTPTDTRTGSTGATGEPFGTKLGESPMTDGDRSSGNEGGLS